MEYDYLGRSGLKVRTLCVGTCGRRVQQLVRFLQQLQPDARRVSGVRANDWEGADCEAQWPPADGRPDGGGDGEQMAGRSSTMEAFKAVQAVQRTPGSKPGANARGAHGDRGEAARPAAGPSQAGHRARSSAGDRPAVAVQLCRVMGPVVVDVAAQMHTEDGGPLHAL
jgi:hypothetical protein